MASDFVNIVTTFHAAGIKYDVKRDDEKITVIVRAHAGPQNLGYTGFFTAIEFSMEERLLSVATWE